MLGLHLHSSIKGVDQYRCDLDVKRDMYDLQEKKIY